MIFLSTLNRKGRIFIMNHFRKIFYPLESLLYLVLFTLTILGAASIGSFASKWSLSQTKIIYVACFCGASGCWFVPLFEKALKIKVSILADIMIAVDVINCGVKPTGLPMG